AARPADDKGWSGYAEFCLFLGREDEYRPARRSLLSTFGTTTDPILAAETSRTCLLLPAEGDELRQAVALAALAERAARAQRERYMPFVGRLLFAQALAEHRR